MEVPEWHSGLRICCCYTWGTGHNYGVGTIPGPETSVRFGHSQKKKKSNTIFFGGGEGKLGL